MFTERMHSYKTIRIGGYVVFISNQILIQSLFSP